jgi:gas vesicle protein
MQVKQILLVGAVAGAITATIVAVAKVAELDYRPALKMELDAVVQLASGTEIMVRQRQQSLNERELFEIQDRIQQYQIKNEPVPHSLRQWEQRVKDAIKAEQDGISRAYKRMDK